VVVPSTSTSGGNAQPIDFLVTDVTGGDPTPYAAQVLALLQKVPGATSVNSTGTQLARRFRFSSIATKRKHWAWISVRPRSRRRRLRRERRNPVRDDRWFGAGAGHLSGLVSNQPRRLEVGCRTLVERRHRLSERHRSIRIDSDVAADYPHRSQQRHPRRRKLRPELIAFGGRKWIAQAPAVAPLAPNIVVRPAPLGQQDFMHQTLVGMGSR